MLRYLEQEGLVVPARSDSGYRRYGIRELNQLNALAELRTRRRRARRARVRAPAPPRAFAPRRGRDLARRDKRPEPEQAFPAWVDWEQRKHERLLAADAA